MAFDKSMLLTYVALALVVVTGVVFCINGDFSEDDAGLEVTVGDYIEVYTGHSVGEESGSYITRTEVVSVETDESGNEELLVREYVDGEFENEYQTSLNSFLGILGDDFEEAGYNPVRTETVTTGLGPRECYICEIDGSVDTVAYVGVENYVLYYQYSTFMVDGELYEFTEKIIATSVDI